MSYMFAGCFDNCGGILVPGYMEYLGSKRNNNSSINEKVGNCLPQYGLKEIIGLENFDISKIEYIQFMFADDRFLEKLVYLSINDHELEYDKDYVVGGNRIEFTLFGLEYLKSLDDGRYYVTAKYSDTNYESEAIINFESVVNPKTGDANKLLYVFLLLSISVYALFVLRKENYNL